MAGRTIGTADIEVRAKLDRLERGLNEARRDVRRFGREAERNFDHSAHSARRLDGAVNGVTMALRTAAAAAAAYVATRLATAAIRDADAFTQLTGRIGLYTESAQETEQVISGLRQTAFELGTEFNALGELYARLAPAQDQLGASTQDLLDITEATSLGLTLSGASAAEQSSVILQLSQAMQSGTLRAEEFNAVNEAGGRIMEALADEMGVSRGALRDLAAEGRITSDVVANALLRNVETFRAELGEIPETVDRASTALRGELRSAWQDLNEELGITEGLARAIRSIAEGIRENRVGFELSADTGEAMRQIGELDQLVSRIQEWQREDFGVFGGGRRIAQGLEIEEEARRVFGADRFEEIASQAAEAGTSVYDALVDELLAARTQFMETVRERLEDEDDEGEADGDNSGSDGGGSDDEAEAVARLTDEIRVAATVRAQAMEAERLAREQLQWLQEYELEHELEMARLRGDDDTVARLEDELEVRKRIADLMQDGGLPREEAETRAREDVGGERAAQELGEFREQFRQAFSEGMLAALQGDEEALRRWFRDAATRGLEDALNNIADALFNLLRDAFSQGSNGEGQGGFLSSALAFAGNLFGGQRALGGPVQAGQVYRVNEGGRPESYFQAPGDGYILNAGDTAKMQQAAVSGGMASASVAVEVIPSPYFDTRVTEIAAPLAQQAGQVAFAASEQRQAKRAKNARKRLR